MLWGKNCGLQLQVCPCPEVVNVTVTAPGGHVGCTELSSIDITNYSYSSYVFQNQSSISVQSWAHFE